MLQKNRRSLFFSHMAVCVLCKTHLCQKGSLLSAPSSQIMSPAKVGTGLSRVAPVALGQMNEH